MKEKIYLSIFILIICAWSSFIVAQTIGTPSPVNITNDGYNSAGVTDRGSGNALDVNVVTGGGGTSSVTGTVAVSSIPSITGNVTVMNPVTAVTTSATTVTPVSGTVSLTTQATNTNPVTQATTTWNVGGAVSITNPVTAVTTSATSVTPVSGTVTISNPVSAVTNSATTITPVSGTVSLTTQSTNTQPVTITNPVTAVTTSTTVVVPIRTTLSSSLTTSQVVVTNNATLIKAANVNRYSLCISNDGTANMWIGSSGVTIATGKLIKFGNGICMDRNTAAIYGIVSSGSTTVGWLEE